MYLTLKHYLRKGIHGFPNHAKYEIYVYGKERANGRNNVAYPEQFSIAVCLTNYRNH